MIEPADIFLCHSSADREFVRRLANDLDLFKVFAWLDDWELEPGDSLLGRIGEALEESAYVAVILSDASARSNWCRKELHQALSKELRSGRKVVIPVLLTRTSIPPFLEEKVFLDFSTNYFEPMARLCGMVHGFDARKLAKALQHSPPRTVDDVRLIFATTPFDLDKTTTADALYLRHRKLTVRLSNQVSQLDFGRICFEQNRRGEALAAFRSAVALDPTVADLDALNDDVIRAAKERRPFEIALPTRIALSYLSVLLGSEDMILNSSHCSSEKEVLFNAARYYLLKRPPDVADAVDYLVNMTVGEPIDSRWVSDADRLLHMALSGPVKPFIYTLFAEKWTKRMLDVWNNHKWALSQAGDGSKTSRTDDSDA